MIKHLCIEGFKSLKKTELKIKPLTLLIGLNSSGKSSVLQFLQILKQSTEMAGRGGGSSNLISQGKFINLGSFADISTGKKDSGTISFKIEGERAQNLEKPFEKTTQYDYSLKVDSAGLLNSETSLSSGDMKLEAAASRNDPKINDTLIFQGGQREFRYRKNNVIGYPFESLGISGDYDELLFKHYYVFLNAIRDDFQDFFMIPAIRGIVSTSYPLDTHPSKDLMDVSNLHEQEMKLASTLVYMRGLMEGKIDKWIKKVTGIEVEGAMIPDKQVGIETRGGKTPNVNIVNEGFGSNQLVHLFAQIAIAPQFSVVGIEEPEVHLHPRAQSELTKVLIEIAQEEHLSLIITTHSEHILYRILIEIAKSSLAPDDIAIYHFRLNNEGRTEIEELTVDKKGRLCKGIPDFLETDIAEFEGFLAAMKA